MHFGESAVGVDVQGRKHVLALREGATENAEAAKDLLRSPAASRRKKASAISPGNNNAVQ